MWGSLKIPDLLPYLQPRAEEEGRISFILQQPLLPRTQSEVRVEEEGEQFSFIRDNIKIIPSVLKMDG